MITWVHFTGNQSGLLTAVQAKFEAQQTVCQINKGHGRIEKRTVSISQNLQGCFIRCLAKRTPN